MKKTVVCALLCVAMAAGFLAGCGNFETSDNAEQETTEEEKTEEVEIWYYWETEGHQVALNKIIDEYNKSQDEYEVESKYVPFADFKKQLSIGASADELPDMVIIDSPDHASYAAMGIFADLTDKFDVSGYYEAPVSSCTLDDTLYGVPFGCNCLGLYYNEEMLNEAGVEVPETWDDLKSAAAALSQGDVTGFAICSVQNEEGTFGFMPFVWSTGEAYETINSEGGIRALTLFKDLTESGAMSKECINWTQSDVMNQFISGNVAMMINGPWQIPTMEEEAPDLNWKVTLIPKDQEYSSDIGGENYAVISGGNEDGAVAFLEYATSEESVKYLMSAFGYIAAQEDIAATQFTGEDNEAYKVFTEQLAYAKARGPHESWPDISDAISLAFNKSITGDATPEDAAKEAQTTIDGVLGE